MSEAPCVSVVMIFLNAAAFIREAIESVVAQTHASWELLLVDDGSTDESGSIAREYASGLPHRIRYLTHPGGENRGMSAARNLGLAHAAGTYVAFLDADDVWLRDALARQVALLDSRPEVGWTFGTTQMWRSWTGLPDAHDFTRRLGLRPDTVYQPPSLLVLFLRDVAKTPAMCAMMLRRSVVAAVGGFEPTFRGMYEDQAFVAKVSLHAPAFVTDACWSRYRQHADSHCAVMTREGQYDPDRPNPTEASFLRWLHAYLASADVHDAELLTLVRERLRAYRYPFAHSVVQRARRRVGRLSERLTAAASGLGTSYEPDLVPPAALMRREGVDVLEDWFRWGDEWSVLLRVYGRLARSSAVLEIGCGVGRTAFALRYVITDGSYDGIDTDRVKVAFLQRFGRAHPHFVFTWSTSQDPALHRGADGAVDDALPYSDNRFDVVYATALGGYASPGVLRHYLRETGRLLKPGGCALFACFVLDHYQRGRPRPSIYRRAEFDFDRAVPEHPDDVAVSNDAAYGPVAYRLCFLRRLAADAGLELTGEPLRGMWSGPTGSWLIAPDVVVLRKGSEGDAPYSRASGATSILPDGRRPAHRD